LEAPEFKKDHNCKDYSRWEDLKVRGVTFKDKDNIALALNAPS
jgi:hypothetical protein